MSKSAQIRTLFDQGGKNVSEIADEVGVRYQFAYNVISRYAAKTGKPIPKVSQVTQATMIRDLYNQGRSIAQIAKEMNTNYTYVHQVISRYRKEMSNN